MPLGAHAAALRGAGGGGSFSPSFRSATGASELSGNSVTIDKPAGVVEGDLLIFFGGYGGSFHSTFSETGWTSLGYEITSDGFCEIMYKVAGASEPADYSFYSGSSSKNHRGSIVAYDSGGVGWTHLSTQKGTEVGWGTDPTSPQITVSEDALITAIALAPANQVITYTSDAALTERSDLQEDSYGTGDCDGALADAVVESGTHGAYSWTGSNTNGYKIAWTIAWGSG